jgi:hypothetical protein
MKDGFAVLMSSIVPEHEKVPKLEQNPKREPKLQRKKKGSRSCLC